MEWWEILMPAVRCTGKDGSPGYRWGTTGPCFTYTKGNQVSRKQAYSRMRAFAYQVSPAEAKVYFAGARQQLA